MRKKDKSRDSRNGSKRSPRPPRTPPPAPRHDEAPKVTLKELAIATRLASGLSDKEIARDLELQPATITSRIRLMRLKLHVKTRAELTHVLGPLLPAPSAPAPVLRTKLPGALDLIARA